MPTTKSNLTRDDQTGLVKHIQKNKNYPYDFPFRRTINGTVFNNADGSIGSYFTKAFTAREILPIISISAVYIITPNTTVDIFCVAVSYNSVFSLADSTNDTLPGGEGGVIYRLLSNGGAINDFQVFYPTDWYMERNSKIYVHVYAGATTVTAGTSTITGSIILGTLPTGA